MSYARTNAGWTKPIRHPSLLAFSLAAIAGCASLRRDSPNTHVSLDSYHFVELRGRASHQGMFPIWGKPTIGLSQSLLVRLDHPVSSASVMLRGADGEAIITAPLRPLIGSAGRLENDGEYESEVTPPSQPFTVCVRGSEGGGNEFECCAPETIQAQYLHITAPGGRTVSPGSTVVYEFVLHNTGPSDRFSITAQTRYGGSLESPENETLALDADATKTFVATARAPDASAPLKQQELLLRIVSISRPEFATEAKGEVDVYE